VANLLNIEAITLEPLLEKCLLEICRASSNDTLKFSRDSIKDA
jgi:hypothetical protein